MQQELKTIGPYKYLSTDLLGEGSYGKVYKCVHTETKQEFALKAIPKTKFTKEKELMNEIEILTRVKSPNIVQQHSILESKNNYYLVLDLCECDLLSIMKKKKFFTEVEATQIMADVLKGFLELIEHGVIHRDLKPANILFSKGTYKIADFGFSRTVDDLSNQKFVSQFGTPMYMSLQILKNDLYTTKCDIWSFGFIFYELLYGRTPWSGQSEFELTKNIQEKDLVFYDQIQPVSNTVKKLLDRCLQKLEVDRISWIQLFRHITFAHHFQQFYNLELKCNKLEKFLATNLRIQIARQNLDIDKIIKHYQCDTTINSKQFYQILYQISQNVSRLEVQQIYDQIKTEAHLNITIEQFKQWLEKFEVTKSMYSKPKQNQCLLELNNVMKKNNTTLQQFYNKFNKDNDGKLKYIEFKQLLCLMNDKLTEQQIQESFNLIDETQKGYITIDEFQKILKDQQN